MGEDADQSVGSSLSLLSSAPSSDAVHQDKEASLDSPSFPVDDTANEAARGEDIAETQKETQLSLLSSAPLSDAVHQDEEASLDSPSFPVDDTANEVARGEDLAGAQKKTQHDVLLKSPKDAQLLSAQSGKVTMPPKATPERIVPQTKTKLTSATKNSSMRMRPLSAQAASSAPCSLCGLRRVEGYVIKSSNKRRSSKKVSP